jgi:hypothetical protein
MPDKICGFEVWKAVFWNGTGGEEDSSVVRVHGGSELRILPFD